MGFHCGPFRSSRQQMFFKIGVLKNFKMFTEKKQLEFLVNIKKRLQYWSFPVDNAKSIRTVLGTGIFFKKRLHRMCFSINIVKFFRTTFSVCFFCFLKGKIDPIIYKSSDAPLQAFCLGKSLIFVISKNVDIDCTLIQNL